MYKEDEFLVRYLFKLLIVFSVGVLCFTALFAVLPVPWCYLALIPVAVFLCAVFGTTISLIVATTLSIWTWHKKLRD